TTFYLLRKTSKRFTCRSTNQFTSSWWMCCCSNPNTPPRRNTLPGLLMTKSSFEFTVLFPRVDISDTLMYVYEMLGAELLSNLYDRLGRLLMDPQESAAWQDTEALLFGFQSIAETIDVNYSDVIPGLIGLIPRINISNVMLADTVMYTIGSLAEWLADHPVMLGGILPMVLRGLVKPELSVSSISTLKRICRECRQDLAPYAQDILTVSQDVLVKEIHESSQCMWLMQALGFLLSALPAEEVLGRLHSLITPHIQQLDSLALQE
ncbi:Importin-13, partial [Ataeniobius toweri]|nr:Importin-13 [Ataeniobius toweri]